MEYGRSQRSDRPMPDLRYFVFRRRQGNPRYRTRAGESEAGTKAVSPLSVVLFDADDCVAFERDERCFRGWSAVDPVFGVVAFGVAFADFVLGSAHGGEHHFGIHADD